VVQGEKSIFSKIIAHEIPAKIIAETDDLIVINDIAPKAEIHYLIIPKKEIRDVQSFHQGDFVLAGKMFEMAQQLSRTIPGAEQFRLVINSGEKVGQKVFHLHMHFLAGKMFFKDVV